MAQVGALTEIKSVGRFVVLSVHSFSLVDTHAHLTDKAFAEDLTQVLGRLREQSVSRVINVGYNLTSSLRVVAMAEQHQDLFAAVGIHPHDAPQALGIEMQGVEELLHHDRVVALGEIGLDYYWNTWPRDTQIEAFRAQIQLAKANELPFIVHDRDAHGDILSVLKSNAPYPAGFVMHCFSRSAEFAEECIRLGGYISLAGPVTFKNAVKAVRVAQAVPLERLLIETDCPYLAPHPWRGKRNEPSYLRVIAERIAEVRGNSLQEVSEQTSANAQQIFRFGGHDNGQ